jgi:hypothetical protein
MCTGNLYVGRLESGGLEKEKQCQVRKKEEEQGQFRKRV